MPNTFDWIEIRTGDIEETARFYEGLFGWKVTEKETADGFDVWIFDTGGEPRVQNLRRGGMWLRPTGRTVRGQECRLKGNRWYSWECFVIQKVFARFGASCYTGWQAWCAVRVV